MLLNQLVGSANIYLLSKMEISPYRFHMLQFWFKSPLKRTWQRRRSYRHPLALLENECGARVRELSRKQPGETERCERRPNIIGGVANS